MKELPDLKCAEVAAAAVKIQKVYRGFQTRKQVEQDLPNLKCAKVVKATVRIQKVFRGYQTRKRLEMAQTAATAVKVQKVSKGFKVSKKYCIILLVVLPLSFMWQTFDFLLSNLFEER